MGKYVEKWNHTEETIVGILALSATGCAFSGVIARYFFSYSPEWLEEMVIYTIIWAVFLISSTLIEERRHVGATFLVEMLPPKTRRLVEILTGFIALSFCMLVCFWGIQIVQLSIITDERSITSMRYPLWVFYLALPTGMGLMAARYIRRLYRLIFCFDPVDLADDHDMSRSAHQQKQPSAAVGASKEDIS